jgi:hypothetical protein
VPAAAYVWLGCCSAEVLPSPKSQVQAVTVPSLSVLVSAKSQVRWVQLTVKETVGASPGSAAVTDAETVSAAPSSSQTTRVTV